MSWRPCSRYGWNETLLKKFIWATWREKYKVLYTLPATRRTVVGFLTVVLRKALVRVKYLSASFATMSCLPPVDYPLLGAPPPPIQFGL
jgi:hypothetical protein